MDRNVESLTTFGSSHKVYTTKQFNTYRLVKTYNRFKEYKSRKYNGSSLHDCIFYDRKGYFGYDSKNSSKQIGIWLRETQNRQQDLHLKDTPMSEESESGSSSEENASFNSMHDEVVPADGDDNCTYFTQCSQHCPDVRSPVEVSKIVWKADFVHKNRKPLSMPTEKETSIPTATHSDVAIEADRLAKVYFVEGSISNNRGEANDLNAKLSGADKLQSSGLEHCVHYIKIMPSQHSMNGLDSKLYKSFLDTLQQVTCYQKLYFDFIETFPMHRFMDKAFTHLMKQGHTDMAFMTQMHKFHRPLPFLQFGVIFPHDHTNTKQNRTLQEQVKPLKLLHNEIIRHDLKTADILSGQVHTQFVHAYLQQKKFGKASRHLFEARRLIFNMEASEVTGWFYLTEAMYHAALPKTGKNYKQQIMESLQKARDHFLLEKDRGKNFSYECCLILWWMLVTITELAPSIALCSDGIRELGQKSCLVEAWRTLSPTERETSKQILQQFRQEFLPLTPCIEDKKTGDILFFMQFFEKLCNSEQVSGVKMRTKKKTKASTVPSGTRRAVNYLKKKIDNESTSEEEQTCNQESVFGRSGWNGLLYNTNQTMNSLDKDSLNSSSTSEGNEESILLSPTPVKPKRIISRSARNARHVVLQKNKPDKDVKIENIEEKYQMFRKDMIRIRAPKYVLSSMSNAKTGKIYVDITNGKRTEAVTFFEKNMPDLFPDIVLTEQKPMRFIGDGCDNYSAGAEKTQPYLARKALQAGNQLLPIRNPDIDIAQLCQREKSLEDITRSHVGMETSTASSAGFVRDQNGEVYKLTVCHPFHGTEDADKMWIPTPGEDSEEVAVLTEIITSHSGQDCGEVVHIGDQLRSAFLPLQVTEKSYKAVDIALVKVKQETLRHPCLQLDQMNNNEEIMLLEVFEGSDKELPGKEVEKTGPITQRTSGKVILADQDTYIDGMPCGGTFLVQSTGKSDMFAQKGDSGSLVTEKVFHQSKLLALGMCFMVGDYIDPASETEYNDVTRCVGLQHCFAFCKNKWDLTLKFCSSSSAQTVKMKTLPSPLSRNMLEESPNENDEVFDQKPNLTTESGDCFSPSPQRKPSSKSCISSDSGFQESVGSSSVSNDELGNVNEDGLCISTKQQKKAADTTSFL